MKMTAIFLLICSTSVFGQGPRDVRDTGKSMPLDYYVYVAAESADEVYKVVFDGKTARVASVVEVGFQPTEIEGPHGLTVGLDGKYWYLSMAHGKPFGELYKFDAATDKPVAKTQLGMFPATMQISTATQLLYCANFNLHGRMLPSSISIVDPEAMVEVGRTTTGPMPHGSRISPDGLHHYSCAMMSGHLFDLDTVSFKVKRRLQLDEKQPENHDSEVKPTWAHPHPKKPLVYVALNGAAQIAEVDVNKWRVVRRFATDKGPYNLEVTPDGKKLVVSYKTAGKVGIWDLESGKELARIRSAQKVTHGVVISPDGRYAFVTSEGVGSTKGALDVFDMRTNKHVSSVELGLQAGGIAFWKAVPKQTKQRTKKVTERDKETGLPLVFSEDFIKGHERWQLTDKKAWTLREVDGNKVFGLNKRKSNYEPKVRSPHNIALIKGLKLSDFIITFKVKSTKDTGNHRDCCVFFCHTDPTHFYYCHLGAKPDPRSGQVMIVKDAPRLALTKNTNKTPWKNDTWHRVKLVRTSKDGRIRVYFDNMTKPHMEVTDKTFKKGRIGIGSFDDMNDFDEIRVYGR